MEKVAFGALPGGVPSGGLPGVPGQYSRTFAPFVRSLRLILLHPQLRNALDQIVRYGLVQWKTEIAFRATIARERFFKACIALDRGKYSDVVLEGGEINKNPMAPECRHSVADGFFRVRSGASNEFANATESGMGRWRCCGNVCIYCRHVGAHLTVRQMLKKSRGTLPPTLSLGRVVPNTFPEHVGTEKIATAIIPREGESSLLAFASP
jgi:hypothetical protein